ncbi:DUF3533 domain-containing protein, partial [Streptomyces sp. SID3343]|nr:DUF3533 domain-containing protein [Streptomyces sp. SID3343]
MTSAPPPTGASAGQILRIPKIWLVPGVLVGLVALVMTLLYMGGILDPNADLRRLPIAVINADTGAAAAPGAATPQNLGARITSAIVHAPDPEHHVSWRPMDAATARQRLASGK